MFELLIIAFTSLFLFIIHGSVCTAEMARGQRMFASGPRHFLDHSITVVHGWIDRKLTYIGKYIITLSWYYSLHTFLILVLKSLAGIYTAIESVVLRNRDRAKQIRREHRRTHLTEIAKHREATALSPKEKAKLKKTALEGR